MTKPKIVRTKGVCGGKPSVSGTRYGVYSALLAMLSLFPNGIHTLSRSELEAAVFYAIRKVNKSLTK